MAARNQLDLGLSGVTGTGSFAGSNSPTFTTPTIGIATVTSINKMAFTAPATGSTFAIANGKTFTDSNTLTLTGTDGSSVACGAGGNVLYALSGTIVQAVSSANIPGSGTSSTTFVDVTGASLSITPKSASNNVLVIINLQADTGFKTATNVFMHLQILSGINVIPTGTNVTLASTLSVGGTEIGKVMQYIFMDSPATSSSITYKLQHEAGVASQTIGVNTTNVTITLMEIHV